MKRKFKLILGASVAEFVSIDSYFFSRCMGWSDTASTIIPFFVLIAIHTLMIMLFNTKDAENIELEYLLYFYSFLLLIGFIEIYKFYEWTFLDNLFQRMNRKEINENIYV